MLLDETTLTAPVAVPADGSRILLVDDDRKLSRILTNVLASYGYSISVVHDGLHALERINSEPWDLVILDVMLPGMDGFEILKNIRGKSSTMVLMLTARGDEADRIVGLEIGADDYVPKTFSSRELLARIRALLRRSVRPALKAAAPEKVLTVGALRIHPESYRVFMNDSEILLTLVEFNLLVCLARAKGRVRTREQLLGEVRDREFSLNDRSIDVHISMLRRKLEGDHSPSRYIRTIRGVGYMAVDTPEFA